MIIITMTLFTLVIIYINNNLIVIKIELNWQDNILLLTTKKGLNNKTIPTLKLIAKPVPKYKFTPN